MKVVDKIYLEQVFMDTGVPCYTFVKSNEYTKTQIAVRTEGKGMIVEGPSGIGKTTTIKKVLEEVGKNKFQLLSARKTDDIELINLLLVDSVGMGVVIIDDFHLLSQDQKKRFADLLKIIADEERKDIKLILIGINNAKDSLIKLSPDLIHRIDVVRFEANPDEKIKELIEKGEKILNVQFEDKNSLIQESHGSFHMAQMLCKEMCIMAEIVEQQVEKYVISIATKDACNRKMKELDVVYRDSVREFAIGTRLRRHGNAPYFHLLYWLSNSIDWSIYMNQVYVEHPRHKASISQIVEKGYLKNICNKEIIKKYLYFDENAKNLTIEDPKFMFYLKNTNWMLFAQEIGFENVAMLNDDYDYDFALSFAGEIRQFPEMLFEILTNEYSYQVFYDNNERSELLGSNIEEYLKPIYESKAEYVVVFLDENYAHKVWTVFESKAYKERFVDGQVIPIIHVDMNITPVDSFYEVGHIKFDLNKDVKLQMQEVAEQLHKKIAKI